MDRQARQPGCPVASCNFLAACQPAFRTSTPSRCQPPGTTLLQAVVAQHPATGPVHQTFCVARASARLCSAGLCSAGPCFAGLCFAGALPPRALCPWAWGVPRLALPRIRLRRDQCAWVDPARVGLPRPRRAAARWARRRRSPPPPWPPGDVPPGQVDQRRDPVPVAEQVDQVQAEPGEPGQRPGDPRAARQFPPRRSGRPMVAMVPLSW